MRRWELIIVIPLQKYQSGQLLTHRVPLWDSRSPVEKFQNTVGAKYQRIDTLKRVKRTFSLYLHYISPKVACWVPRESSLTYNFSDRGKWEHREWVPSFPRCVEHSPRGPFFFSHPENWAWIRRCWEQDRQDTNPNCSTNSIRKLTTSHLGHLTCGPSNGPIGTPDILYVSLPLHLGWFLKCNFPEITFMSCKARTMNKEQLFPECVLMNGECKYLL